MEAKRMHLQNEEAHLKPIILTAMRLDWDGDLFRLQAYQKRNQPYFDDPENSPDMSIADPDALGTFPCFSPRLCPKR